MVELIWGEFMISLKHVGIYVNDIDAMTKFYQECFDMKLIVSINQQDNLSSDILDSDEAFLRINKLITPKGKMTGYGDMLELIQVMNKHIPELSQDELYAKKQIHIALGVDEIEKTSDCIVKLGGKLVSKIHILANNKCCFCQDIEGNYIELIQNL